MKETECRIAYIIALYQRIANGRVTRETEIKGTPIWKICYEPAAFERVRKWLESQIAVRKYNLQFNYDQRRKTIQSNS